MSETTGKTPKIFFRKILVWPNIRMILELVSAIILFAHLIPVPIEENLRETCLGVFFILGTIILFVLFHNFNLWSKLSAANQQNEKEFQEQKDYVLELKSQIEALRTDTIINTNELMKSQAYKSILPRMNKAFALLREAHRETVLLNKEGDEIKHAFREFCNNLNEVFTIIKGPNDDDQICHVCIKILTRTPTSGFRPNQKVKVKVKTLMRDGRGKGNRTAIDKENIEHYIHDNTDFLEIFGQGDNVNVRCFMSNDLLSLEDYKNSSLKKFNRDKMPIFKHARASSEVREREWPLDYKSVITAPISPGIASPNPEDGTLIGFLCVDYNKTGVFNQYDVDIVSGFAEGLYDILDYYIKRFILKS